MVDYVRIHRRFMPRKQAVHEKAPDVNDTRIHRLKTTSDKSHTFLEELHKRTLGRRGYLRLERTKARKSVFQLKSKSVWFFWNRFGRRSADQRNITETSQARDNAANFIVDHIRNAYGHLRDKTTTSRQEYDNIIHDLSDYLDRKGGNLGVKRFNKFMNRLKTFEKRTNDFSKIEELPEKNIEKKPSKDVLDDVIMRDLAQSKGFERGSRAIGSGGFGTVYDLKGKHGADGYLLKLPKEKIDLLSIEDGGINARGLPLSVQLARPSVIYVQTTDIEGNHKELLQVPVRKWDEMLKEHPNDCFFVCGYLIPRGPGAEVHDWIGRMRTDTEARRNLARSSLQSVLSLHEHGYVHFDIKPSNLMYESSENERLSKVTMIDTDSVTKSPGFYNLFTAGYAAPEYLKIFSERKRKKGKCGPEVDYFSLAMTFLSLVDNGVTLGALHHHLMKHGKLGGNQELRQENVEVFSTLRSGKEKLDYVLKILSKEDPRRAARLQELRERDDGKFFTVIENLMGASQEGDAGKKCLETAAKILGVNVPENLKARDT